MDEQISGGPTEWLTLPDVAERLDLSISKVNQMVKDGLLLVVRHDGVRRVPADLIATETALRHLPGILNVLRDAGYNDEEALEWLYIPDDSLAGGCAAVALGGPNTTEVKRRAQALGF
ncbi:Rv2175c family DNA-binding protein [Pilimelia columellifera]|uniref:Rv2175c family DNA-binding protein n=1 Tax=Pilimelia columellifera subsp. columellifera TaxID=706583 RepID=A0ABP6AKA9_9ACTN